MIQAQNRFIILKKTKYGEADLILQALSSSGEKVSFIARSALKSKKRFGGGILEPTHFVQFTYKQGANSNQLNVLQEAILINDFAGLRKSYDHIEFALHVLECVSRVSQEGDRESGFLFNLLGHTLRAIEATENMLILKMHFYLKFLLQQGVMTAEPWMAPFLCTKLSENKNLKAHQNEVRNHLFTVETMVQSYLQNATL